MKKIYLFFMVFTFLYYSSNIYAQAASIMWPLTSNTSPNAPTGNIQGTNESIGIGPSPTMSILSYYNGQRLWVGNTGWVAGSIDFTRYIQFDASPTSGNNFTVTNVSFIYGDNPLAANFNVLKSQTYYSTDGWVTKTVLNVTPLSYLNSSMSTFTVSGLNVLVANGQNFSLRIYPYSPTGSNPMTPSFAIHDTVVINGTTSPSTNISACTDFEDSTFDGWQVNNTLESIKLDGANHYIETTDQSGPSTFFNSSKPLIGNWTTYLTGGCGSLCWDVTFLYGGDNYNGQTPPQTVTPYITIIGNGDTASFVTNGPITAGDGWHSYCAPLSLINTGDPLPSNSDGHWVMSVGSNSPWNSLLSNVTSVRLPVDPTSYQNERFGYDNICLKNTGDCTPPPQFGSICGMKFNDLNGNGVQDPGEPGLPNWIINLSYQGAAGIVTLTGTTDANGNYCFNNLQPGGIYTVSETNQTGWQQTFPLSPGTYTLPLTSGEHKDSVNFGNRLSTAQSDTCQFLCNTDFEDNQVVSVGSQGFFNESLISCWKTTESDSIIEVWGSGFNGVPAYSGNQFIELNAYTVSTLYQDFTAISGSTRSISFAHRGRYTNPDVMNVKIGPNGGPYVLLGTYSDNNTAWSYYTVSYTFPTGGPYELRFESVSSNGGAGPAAGGNFLDAISIHCPSSTTGSICDSLKANASKITPGDCDWSLSLSQPSNLTGIGSIQIVCLSPNLFTTGTGLGSNFQTWFTSANTYFPPTGHVPGGNLNDFFRMNINYVTSPQIIVVNWLDSLGNKVCSDTLKLDCQISCTTILNDTVTCNGNGYNFSYNFTNNATYSISNIEYTLQSPSGVTISPAADTLSPALAANATSGTQNIQISGGMPGDTVKILAKYISSGGCCWCFETFNVILPNCKTVCDSLGVSAAGSSADCCYSISLTNNSATVFSSVQFQLLSGGMFSTVATTSAPGWGFTNIAPNNMIDLIKLPFGQGIGNGTFSNILDMCIRQYPDSNQVIAVKWIKNGQVICTDTLRFECIPTTPPTDTCSQVINGTMTCLQNGNVQYIFRVQNNSTINSTGFGIFPMTPGVSFSKTIFNSTNILPGQVSPIDTLIISGIGANHTVCLQTSIFVTVDSIYNYCCHSDTVCITTPDCGTKDSSEACINWSLLSDQSVTSVIGNINGTPESIGVGSSSPFMSIFLPYISTGQRLWVGNTGWVAGPLDPSRYIEFDASPNPGNNFTVTNVSCNYGDLPLGTDFNIINFKAYYSIDGWVNSAVLNSTALIYKNTAMLSFNQAINVLVPNGKTFSLRIFPYAIQNGIAITPTFAIHNNVIICGTTSTVTSIDDSKTGSAIPKSFQLQQNFPNPFNPSSIIRYDIPKTSFVKISVYDILGREIKVLVNEDKSPGHYEIIFDANGLASGIYFYTIRTGEFTQIKKMILMK